MRPRPSLHGCSLLSGAAFGDLEDAQQALLGVGEEDIGQGGLVAGDGGGEIWRGGSIAAAATAPGAGELSVEISHVGGEGDGGGFGGASAEGFEVGEGEGGDEAFFFFFGAGG